METITDYCVQCGKRVLAMNDDWNAAKVYDNDHMVCAHCGRYICGKHQHLSKDGETICKFCLANEKKNR